MQYHQNNTIKLYHISRAERETVVSPSLFNMSYDSLPFTPRYVITNFTCLTTVHSRYVEVGGNKKKYRDNESSRYPIWRF